MLRGRQRALGVAVVLAALVMTSCSRESDGEASPGGDARVQDDSGPDDGSGVFTLAFAGDIHFEAGLAGLPDSPDSTLGEMSRPLREADLSVVNLESALASGGEQTRKELEVADNRFWFRSPPSTLGLLERSGVDAVTLANNHGADYGRQGLEETLDAASESDVAVLGVGADGAEAFTPYRREIGGTDVAVLAADSSMRESADPIWKAGEGGPGIAAARTAQSTALLEATAAAAETDDVVVVYLHWGEESSACPSDRQQTLAAQLAEAGADVVVGSHAHVVLGSGLLDETYVNYGLGNFAWYHGRREDTGVLRLRMQGDRLLDEDWLPGRIPLEGGVPVARTGADRQAALERQARARGCTDLEAAPGAIGGGPALAGAGEQDSGADADADADADSEGSGLPPYAAEVRQIGPYLRDRMTASHDPSACPVSLDDLRYLKVRHVDFDGEQQTGELVVAADAADDVVGVFRDLYRARFPIERMELVDAYDADDDASMAANNSSAYNCRTVAGQQSFSDHAYGQAIDINPVQNPYRQPDGVVVPPAGEEYVDIDRSPGAEVDPGVIRDDDVVVRAFRDIGWEWGDGFSDYQHFFVP